MTTPQQQKVMNDLLIEAVRSKDVKQARLYIDKGADVHVTLSSVMQSYAPPGGGSYSASGKAPLLHVAIQDSNFSQEMVNLLIEKGVDIDATNFKGNTPLMIAVKDGNYSRVSFYLQHGANPLATNSDGEMVLDEARKLVNAFNRRQDMINALLAAVDNPAQTQAQKTQSPQAQNTPATQGEIKVMKPVTFKKNSPAAGGGFKL